jgi:hypothetical protein
MQPLTRRSSAVESLRVYRWIRAAERRTLWLAAALLCIEGIYYLIASAGRWETPGRALGERASIFVLLSAATFAAGLLVERIARRLFPSASTAWVLLAILALALANPMPYLLASPLPRHAWTAAGQAFLLMGLVVAFDAVWQSTAERPEYARLIGAGSLWGFALATRLGLGLAVLVFVAATAIIVTPAGPRRARRRTFALLALGAPLLACVGVFRASSSLRFAWLALEPWLSSSPPASLDYWVPNAYAYFLRPYETSCQFPFVISSVRNALPDWMKAPDGYVITRPLVGWIRAVPIAWLGVVVVLAAFVKRLRWGMENARSDAERTKRQRALAFCITALVALSTLTGVTEIGRFSATMSALAEVTYGLVFVGVLGGFLLQSAFRLPLVRIVVASVYTALILGTLGFGLLFGYQGHDGHFELANPTLDAMLVRKLSTCPVRAPR